MEITEHNSAATAKNFAGEKVNENKKACRYYFFNYNLTFPVQLDCLGRIGGIVE
jgi:hypothetical protein